MATSSHSQSINGKRARGKLNVTNNYYTGTKEGLVATVVILYGTAAAGMCFLVRLVCISFLCCRRPAET